MTSTPSARTARTTSRHERADVAAGGAEVAIRAAAPEDVPAAAGADHRAGRVRSAWPTRSLQPRSCSQTALFGERPAAEALIAELDGEAGRLRDLLSDLLYLPGRSRGCGWRTCSYARARRERWFARGSVGRGGGPQPASAAAQRLEWSALDWNDLALDFYRGLGASPR